MDASLIPTERIERAILLIRGEKVMLDSDLAALYGVETKRLNEQVRRNLDRFPADFNKGRLLPADHADHAEPRNEGPKILCVSRDLRAATVLFNPL